MGTRDGKYFYSFVQWISAYRCISKNGREHSSWSRISTGRYCKICFQTFISSISCHLSRTSSNGLYRWYPFICSHRNGKSERDKGSAWHEQVSCCIDGVHSCNGSCNGIYDGRGFSYSYL